MHGVQGRMLVAVTMAMVEMGTPVAQERTTVEAHRVAARAAAGDDHLGLLETVCRVPQPIPDRVTDAPRPPRVVPSKEEWHIQPFQVFDNLYFVGTQDHGAWAVTTAEGIILIDALYDYAVEAAVVDGLRTLGLDPEEIAYVVISHGHGDHHGGTKHLQDRFGARVVMGGPDWDLVMRSTRDPIPSRDLVATDEMEISLGETTVALFLTPGHTAGTVSTMIEVRDGGRSHVTASWGGTSLFATTSLESIQAYIDSAVRYQQLIAARGADVLLANHTRFDRTLEKRVLLANRQPGDPHPYVIGTEAVQRYLKVAEECARAELLRRTGSSR